MITVKVYLKTRRKTEYLFDYNFIDDKPQTNDEIREDDKVYTITNRYWDGGHLCVEVTNQPKYGVIPA
jgi:hypothetical protein